MQKKGNFLEDLEKTKFLIDTLKNNLLTKTKLMGKFDYLNNEVIKMFNSNNSNIARDLLPNGNDLEISSLKNIYQD
jgi:hypothetical protein